MRGGMTGRNDARWNAQHGHGEHGYDEHEHGHGRWLHGMGGGFGGRGGNMMPRGGGMMRGMMGGMGTSF